MWWRVPKRALFVGGAVVVGRWVWWRMVRKGRQPRASPTDIDAPDDFPDTEPAVWSCIHEAATGGSQAGI
jgi:hypothetical protein